MKSFYQMLLVFGVALTLAVGGALAQDEVELEIVDQDGRPVQINRLKINQSKPSKVDVQVDDGKIVIIDENGERREIDVTGAQSIIVNKSVSSIMQDGEEEKKVSGKAIIIGPDGQRQEIELGDGMLGDGLADLQLPPMVWGNGKGMWAMPGKIQIERFDGGSKYAIGIRCQTVSDALRAHVDIEDGIGLVVVNPPVPGSPAAEAGVQQHDILTFVNQTPLTTINDLVDAVQTSGTAGKPVSVTLLRKGKEIGVELTPVERKSFAPDQGGLLRPGFDFRMEEIGPGLIIDDRFDDLMQQMDDRMKARMDALNEQLQQRMDEMMMKRFDEESIRTNDK